MECDLLLENIWINIRQRNSKKFAEFFVSEYFTRMIAGK